jgi:hypothetical protein
LRAERHFRLAVLAIDRGFDLRAWPLENNANIVLFLERREGAHSAKILTEQFDDRKPIRRHRWHRFVLLVSLFAG